MISAIRRALRDMNENRFLNAVAVLTVALAVLIAGAFSLIWTNVNHWMQASEANIRILVYLKDGVDPDRCQEIQRHIQSMPDVSQVTYISRSQALEKLRIQLQHQHQSSLIDGLSENPLPDSLEVDLKNGRIRQMGGIAEEIGRMPGVDSVEYGQQWFGRFAGLLNLFRFSGIVLGSLFFIASGLIIANTARLVLYSRQEEVEIMRLVGATDGFITAPFYIQALIQGIFGCTVGLGVIYAAYVYMFTKLGSDLASGFWTIRFLPAETIAVIAGCCIGIGWIGCFLSMKQFFRS